MKKIFLILSLFVSIVSFGQIKAARNAVGTKDYPTKMPGGALIDSILNPPNDTLASAPWGSIANVGNKLWFKKQSLGFWDEVTTGDAGYSNLTEFIDQGNWRVFYSDGSGNIQELSLGAAGTFLGSNGTTSVPSFQSPGTSIGSSIVSGTTGSVLFVDPTAVIAQDNANFFWNNTDNYLGVGTNVPVGTVTIWQGTGNKGMWLSGNGKLGGFPNISRAFGMMLGYSDADNVQGMIGSLENYGSSTLGFFRVRTSTFNSFDAITGTGATMNLNIGSGDKNVTIGSDDPASALNKLSVIGRISVGTNVATTVAPTDGILVEGQIQSEKEQKLKAITAPGTPAAGYAYLYIKSSDKKLYWKDDAGLETLAGGGGGGADADATYIVQTSTDAPANAQILDALTAGIIKVNASGVLETATAGSDYATVSNIHYEIAAKYATTAALPANTYNNGTLGVGRTLTATANGAISVDGNTPSVNDRILVKNQATQANNGIYSVTQVGDGSNPYILTGVTDHDESIEVAEGDVVTVTAGTAPPTGNTGTSWYQSTIGTITMGTTAIVFTLIPAATAGLADTPGDGFVVRDAPNETINRTLTGTANRLTITNGSGVGGDPVFDVGSNIIDKSVTNTYTSGAKQIFGTNATNSGFSLAGVTANPSSLVAGDFWFRSDNGRMTYYNGSTTQSIVAEAFAQTLTNKTIDFTDNTISATIAQLNSAVSDADVATIAGTETWTNKRITLRTGTVASSATPTINTDNVDYFSITAQTVDITSFTTNLSGTPTLGQQLKIKITGTAARAIAWGASFANGPVALPTTTVTTLMMHVLLEWDGSIWRCMAAGSN